MAKFFALADANRTLPLVKRIVQDILDAHPQWKDLVARYELVAARSRPEWGESKEQLDLKTQVDEVAGKINAYLRELEEIGCEFKDFDKGLVDFHGRLEGAGAGAGAGGGREILWCWQFGEDRIAAWHELDAGFAGRQPLPEMLSQT